MRIATIVTVLGLWACGPAASDVQVPGTGGTATGAGTVTGVPTGTATGSTTGTTTGATSGTGGDCANGGVEILGCLTHDGSGLVFAPVLDSGDGLNLPRDLEFHPNVVGELWVVNRADNGVVIAGDAGLASMTIQHENSGDNQVHFLAQPSALAFNAEGNWASIHEEDDWTQGVGGSPQDFMGPTLWSGNSGIFDGGHFSHLDMLHNSPNGMGIAWDVDNAFWVFDGYHSSLTRYNFKDDHDLGGTDHGDGALHRFAKGEVAMKANVPSHLWFDVAAQLLYVNDTGNNRILQVDPTTATPDGSYGPNYDGGTQTEMAGAMVTVLVDGADLGMVSPSGLEEHNGLIFVSDNGTGYIHAFDKSGNPIDWLDTGFGPGALMGLAFDPQTGELWFVDALNDEVWRISL
jgi:hypothetical protein